MKPVEQAISPLLFRYAAYHSGSARRRKTGGLYQYAPYLIRNMFFVIFVVKLLAFSNRLLVTKATGLGMTGAQTPQYISTFFDNGESLLPFQTYYWWQRLLLGQQAWGWQARKRRRSFQHYFDNGESLWPFQTDNWWPKVLLGQEGQKQFWFLRACLHTLKKQFFFKIRVNLWAFGPQY